jgi:cell division protein FtsB
MLYSQSLGEVPKQAREERQSSTTPKVITNEDLANKSVPAENVKAPPEQSPSPKQTVGNTDKQEERKDAEAQKSGEEVDRRYRERIAQLLYEIKISEYQIVWLKSQYNRWDIPLGDEVDLIAQQNFNQHITDAIAQEKRLIADLKSQLEAVQEEARHAGVPHATD